MGGKKIHRNTEYKLFRMAAEEHVALYNKMGRFFQKNFKHDSRAEDALKAAFLMGILWHDNYLKEKRGIT